MDVDVSNAKQHMQRTIGNGAGVQEDGSQEHVRVSYKGIIPDLQSGDEGSSPFAYTNESGALDLRGRCLRGAPALVYT